MNIEVSDETINVIQTFTGMTIEEFLEQTKNDLLEKYQDGNIMTVKEAAKIMGKSQQFIRVGLQRNLLPFGVAFKMSNKYSYYISPKKFYEYVGGEVLKK
jgi:seryl-tRNA synthetase